MTAIDASVPELSSVRRPLTLLPSSDFALFTSATTSATVAVPSSTSSSSSSSPTANSNGCGVAESASPSSSNDDADHQSLHQSIVDYDVARESMASTIIHRRSRGGGQQFGSDLSDLNRELNGDGGITATSSAGNGGGSSSNWLADLSVEVCKVNEDVDDSQSGVVGVGGGVGGGGESECDGGGAGDWDEAVVFFEAAAAAEAVCCSSGGDSAAQTHHHHHNDHLDVLLGNPSLHNSSGSDLLDLDPQSCCTVDFPLLDTSGRSSCNSNSSSCGEDNVVSHHLMQHQQQQQQQHPPPHHRHQQQQQQQQSVSTATAATGQQSALSSPSASTSSPSSVSGAVQPLPQPPQPCSVSPDKVCNKVFTNTSALAKHKLTHSDERRFSCQLCGKAFKRQDHLNGHLITHREKKPFECRADGCGKSYCDARSLRRHQDNHHAPAGQNAQQHQSQTGITLSQQQLSMAVGGGDSMSSPPTIAVLNTLQPPSRSSSSSSSSSAGLFISELSAGSADLMVSSAGGSYTAPSSNSSSASSGGGHHFTVVSVPISSSEPYANWAATTTPTPTPINQGDPLQSDPSSCSIQYVQPPNSNGYLTQQSELQAPNSVSTSPTATTVCWSPEVISALPPPLPPPPPPSNENSNQSNKKSSGNKSNKNAVTKTTAPAAATTKVKKTKAKTTTTTSVATATITSKTTTTKSGHKRAGGANTESSSSGNGNDGLTTQQLELIQEIMRQTQEQHRLMQEEQHSNKSITAPHSATTATSKAKKANSRGGGVKWTSPAPANSSSSSSSASVASAETSSQQQNTTQNSTSTDTSGGQTAGRPVECNVCQRRFKNTPALNGHMRLHGGFLKKDAECNGSSNTNGNGGNSGGSGGGSNKKPGDSKKDPNTPPLLTASVSIRALIEEKIIQRRNNMAGLNGHQVNNTTSSALSSISSTSTTTSVASSSSSANLMTSAAHQERSVNNNLPTTIQLTDQLPEPLSQESNTLSLVVVMEQQQQHVQETPMSHVPKMELIPKMEPEAYFEGSLLALSPVSLHRALEGDVDVNDDDPTNGDVVSGVSSALHHHLHHSENFFSTSSSSSSALSDVPLLESVFHQVSAEAASALLSDISSLDLQSYIDSSGGSQGHQQNGQQGNQFSDCLSQYLAAANDSGSSSSNYHDANGFQPHHSTDDFTYQHHDGVNSHSTVGGFSFDPSPSTPLSSLCSPQHYVQQYQHQQQQIDSYHNSAVDNGSSFQSMLMATAAPSPYTPSPSPVSPAVGRFQQQQQQQQANGGGFYSSAGGDSSSFSVHPQLQHNSFMIDCANSVLYNMESGGGWDHAADLSAVASEAIPHLIEQQSSVEQNHQLGITLEREESPLSTDVKVVRLKKPRPSRAKKLPASDEPEAKRRKNSSSTKSTKSSTKKRDEFDEFLNESKMNAGSSGGYSSAMRTTPPNSLLLDPKRNGTGLYWNLVRDNQVVAPPLSSIASKTRVRIGKEFQCTTLPRCKKKEGNKEKELAVLCWSGSSLQLATDHQRQQVARLLAWSRLALPGAKRGEEEVLSVLTHFRGDVQATKLHVFSQVADSNSNWSPDEIAVFQAALLQLGKDFPQIAQHLPSKTVGQCVQFYYVWKKLCRPQEYATFKMQCSAAQSNPSLTDETSLSDWPDVGSDLMSLNQNPVSQDCSSSSSPTSLLLPSCEFGDCPAISTSRAGRRYQGIRLDPATPPPSSATDKHLYPCSVCQKVFDKVKSRSAHMKTHKSSLASSSTSSSLNATTTTTTTTTNNSSPCRLGNNVKSRKNHKSPLMGTPSPLSSASHSSLSSTSCSLPSPFLPSQNLF